MPQAALHYDVVTTVRPFAASGRIDTNRHRITRAP